MLTLSIQHNIYLNKEERYQLHNQEDIDTVGVSLPVWHFDHKSSEPVKEIFCNYFLRNPHKELPIKIMQDGYLICLPYRIPSKTREVTNEEWMQMSQEKREAHYTASSKEMSSASLLDVQDGGSETLMYREKNTVKSNEKFMKIIHYINIYDVKYLEGSIEYVQRKNDEARRKSSE